jgi:hypothetical protein
MVARGQLIAFDFEGTAGGWSFPTTVDAVRSEITAELSDAFTVHNIEIRNVGAMYELLEWQFVGRVELSPIQGFAEMSHARSVVVNAIYQATGYMPAVADPGSGWVPTTETGILDSIGGALRDVVEGITGRLDAVAQGAQDTTNLLLILTAGVLVALVVSAGGKTTRIGLG